MYWILLKQFYQKVYMVIKINKHGFFYMFGIGYICI